MKTKLERRNESLKRLLNEDQLKALEKRTTRGMQWEDATIKKALQLQFACGTTGYEAVKDLPLPSLRTLQRRVQKIPFHPAVQKKIFNLMKQKARCMYFHAQKALLSLC